MSSSPIRHVHCYLRFSKPRFFNQYIFFTFSSIRIIFMSQHELVNYITNLWLEAVGNSSISSFHVDGI